MPPDAQPVVSDPTIMLQGWIPLLGLLVALLAPLGPAIFGVMTANRNAKRAVALAEDTAVATKDVAKKLAEARADTSQKLDTIHSLVNSRLTAALEKISRLERRLIEVGGALPEDDDEPTDNPTPLPPPSPAPPPVPGPSPDVPQPPTDLQQAP